jgi:hypothetical protein
MARKRAGVGLSYRSGALASLVFRGWWRGWIGRVSGRFGSESSILLLCALPPSALEEFDDLKQTVCDDQAHANGNEVKSHWNLVMVREQWWSSMRAPGKWMRLVI